MRGRMVPDHCAAEVPQGSDHSSPASFQSYLVDWVRIAVLAKAWLGLESNRRHVDFQSMILTMEKSAQFTLHDGFMTPKVTETTLQQHEKRYTMRVSAHDQKTRCGSEDLQRNQPFQTQWQRLQLRRFHGQLHRLKRTRAKEFLRFGQSETRSGEDRGQARRVRRRQPETHRRRCPAIPGGERSDCGERLRPAAPCRGARIRQSAGNTWR